MSETNNELQESSESGIITPGSYMSDSEKTTWWYISNYGVRRPDISKQAFHTRRSLTGFVYSHTWKSSQVLRTSFGNSNHIGAFLRLTNSYLLVCGEDESKKFCSTVSNDLYKIPLISTTIGGCNSIGCMCIGNKHGLIVPETIYDTELQQIKEQLPDSVEVRKIEERLSALGNVVVCNDHVALIHPDLDKESEEIIANTLQVEVFRHVIANNPLVGSYCVLNNYGGLVHINTNNSDLENLSSLLQIPLVAGTVNCGVTTVASGLVANDSIAYAGMKTTSKEIGYIQKAFSMK